MSMNRKLAGWIAEAGKKTAVTSTKHSLYLWFHEPKMPKSLIQKQK